MQWRKDGRFDGGVDVQTEPDESTYHAMIMSLRAVLADETDRLYCLHTPVGTINVSEFRYGVSGFIAIRGEDEQKNHRFFVFSEEQVRSFPLEIKRKSLETSKEPVGFKP
jgi:hypothetical protein